jgi:CCAAT-binding transcription factor (CBF-B/NF-YA) subunit B
MATVAPMSSSSAHQRRDSNVGMGIDHSQGQTQFTHHTHSPPLRQQQQQHHPQHTHQSMSSRPRSTSAVTIDVPGSSAALMHDSRPRAHSYADPRAAAEQRVKHSQTPVVKEIVFTTTATVQELDEEPLYVNAKQYHRILKRRLARARLAEIQKLSTQRKVGRLNLPRISLLTLPLQPYLHQSRHNHAVRRPRGPGGRFLTAEEIAARKAQGPNDQDGDEDAGAHRSSESPAQESTSSPGDDGGSPTRASVEKSSKSTGPTPVTFSYPTPAANPPTSAGVLEFDNVGLGSILGTNATMGINSGYDYGTVTGAD